MSGQPAGAARPAEAAALALRLKRLGVDEPAAPRPELLEQVVLQLVEQQIDDDLA